MTNQKRTLSASNIKYLLTLRELCTEENKIRCVNVAECLGISKPSVHAMMNALKEMCLIRKDRYGAVRLTDEGKALAEQYSGYYETVWLPLQKLLPAEPELMSAICAFLAELPAEALERMCQKLRMYGVEERTAGMEAFV